MTTLRSSSRIVDKIEVDVVCAQASKGFLDRIIGACSRVFIVPDFRGDVYRRAW